MRFNQVHEVLDHLIYTSTSITEAYERLLDTVESERTRMLLHYLFDKETENITHLKDVKNRMAEKLLLTWIDEDIDHSLIDTIDHFKVEKSISTNELMAIVTNLQDKKIEWLNVIVNIIPNHQLQVQFNNITQYLVHKHQQLNVAVHRMDDM